MRPPSYYSNLLNSNPTSNSYRSSNSTSSQFRSSFSSNHLSQPSSAYVNRTHLPYVAQSTLIAHCITGVGSSTRPSYNSSSSTSTSFLSSAPSSSYSSSTSYRPISTKRHHTNPYLSASSSSSSYLSPSSSSSYLRSKSTTSHSSSGYSSSSSPSSRSSYYRPTLSSYYQPIRLRERPLLTQISRHITSVDRTQLTSSRPSVRINDSRTSKEDKQTLKEDVSSSFDNQNNSQIKKEDDWSSDIARNISRNKYLIKFREFDKSSKAQVTQQGPIELINQVLSVETPVERVEGEVSVVLKQEKQSTEEVKRVVKDKSINVEKSKLEDSIVGKVKEQKSIIDKEKLKETKSEESPKMKIPTSKNEDIVVETCLKPKVIENEKQVKVGMKPKKIKAVVNKSIVDQKVVLDKVPKESALRVEKIALEKENKLVEKSCDTIEKPIENSKITLEPVEIEKKKVLVEKKGLKLKLNDVTNGTKINIENKIETKVAKTLPIVAEELAKVAKKVIVKQTNQVAVPEVINKVIKEDKESISRPLPSSTTTNPVQVPAPVPATAQKSETQTQFQASSPPSSSGPPPKVKVRRLVKNNSKTKLAGLEEQDSNVKDKSVEKKMKIVKVKSGVGGSKEKKKKKRKSSLEEKSLIIKPEEAMTVSKSDLDSPAIKSDELNSPSTLNKRIRFRDYHLEDFNFLTVLGHGGWGFVILAELKEHDACFAVKCIKKITIVEDDDFDSIMIERKVLALGNVNPFICKLFCTFETPGYLFFAMEFCPGGDLMFHVQHEGKFTEPRCRFYAAEIICAIRFLHNRHIIYRDLKLDNILLDAEGHVRLVDFGMCQCRTYREEMLPSNFCGTPEYISPEIIKGVPYNHSVDWWSFGVLLYEMAVGKMPFRGNDENELLWNVCYEQIHYPMFLSRELTLLLQLLLEREPTKRMGMATCKSGDIYDQAWFRGTDWSAFEKMKVKPPFVPEVTSKRDVQNFDADFTESAPELSPVDESTLKRIDQSQFQKFPYTNPEIAIFNS